MRDHDGETGPGRRRFLGAGLAAGAALALAGCTPEREPATPAFDPADWESVRAQFPLRTDHAHFAAFVLAAHPDQVRRAIERHRRGLDADTDAYLHEDRETPVLRAAASYLGTPESEIALTDSTTMGLGILFGGLRLRPGQDVVTTEHDFYATHEGLRLLAARTGAEVRRARLYDDPAAAGVDEIVSRLRAAIRPATRVVAITWVHSGTGVRLPVKEISGMIAEINSGRDTEDRALLCVDGVHGFGAVADRVGDLGCDFLATGTHKWLFGPRGTGVLWGRAWDAVAPVIPSFTGDGIAAWIGGYPPAGNNAAMGTPGGYHSFEHRWALDEAFAFHGAIGRDRIAARTAELATRLKQGLAGIPSLRLVTPASPELSAGLVCCSIAGQNPGAVAARLREQHRIVAGVTPYSDAYLRFGTSIVTSPEDVDRAVKAVAAL
ncbi:class V aminotransferase [Microtetraspora sp. NBRC 13810]|uniref:aminotransferase class V-fold PLP-dependent enzyme n=1 Tax=Microtetraspora sp. NBRC 13810 TaxID=3030990 RepID=UPI0024A3D00D|nr:aminotransferase class V-fold PLP-dependent enzyme [Microtetraspora sp. NBRC 13810]GLW08306.1 class V aminotransferase [Microtetraspora sp. NBRC 13810]